MALATPSGFAPGSRHKCAFSSSPDSRSAGMCRNSNFLLKGAMLRVAPQHSNNNSNSSCRGTHSRRAALDESTSAADPETLRLVTAATILASSPSSSPNSSSDEAAAALAHAPAGLNDLAAAAAAGGSADDGADDDDPLALLEDLQQLDADSLSLVVGILRRQAPLEVEETDVELSERLRDFLLLLKQRPSKLMSAAAAGASPRPAVHAADTSSTNTNSSSSSSEVMAEGFWAGPDEWADVRSALMSIGIDASVDEEDDEEDVWLLEEEGPAVRRTRLLKRLPKLDPGTAAELSVFLAEAQQRSGKAGFSSSESGTGGTTSSSSAGDGAGAAAGSNGRTAAADRPQLDVVEDEELWWGSVTHAYRLLWQQARLQQLQQRSPAADSV